MNPPEVTCKIDTRNWVIAQSVLLSHTKTKTSQGLARAVAFVVKDAKKESMKRNVPISRIDSDLDRLITRRTKSKRPSKTGNLTVGEAIVMARMNPASKYNISTDSRWKIPKSVASIKGFAKAYGSMNALRMFLDVIIKPIAERQKSARHSSSGFLAISWNPILDAISTYVDKKYQASVGAWSGYTAKKKLLFGVGDARMVGEGTQKCALTIFNYLGMSSLYPNLDKKRNEAIHRILGPILQDSVNKNFNKQCQVAWDKYGIDLKTELRRLGFK